MGEIIIMNDVNTSKLTPAGQAKMKEWYCMDALRRQYIASMKAELARNGEHHE